MTTDDKILTLLTSIDATLKQMLQLQAKGAGLAVATDKDLDGKYGNPLVKFKPRDWAGPSYVGKRFSDCPAEFLDIVAETFDYFAKTAEEKDERYNGKPVAPYKRADAARARGWALRIRSGKVSTPAVTQNASDDFPADDWDIQDGMGHEGCDTSCGPTSATSTRRL
jgi:hypothetical protein